MLEPFTEVPVDRPIAELAGRLRRQAEILIPDALIAATGLVGRLTLVTRNARDFEPVPKLKFRESR